MGIFTDWLSERKIDNPYTKVIARHLDSVTETEARVRNPQSVGAIPGILAQRTKNTLGTLLGVPGELSGQLFQDVALAGNAELERSTNPTSAAARAYEAGGVDAYGAALDPRVRGAVGAQGTVLSLLPDLLIGGGGNAAQRSVQRASKLDIPKLAARAKQVAQAAPAPSVAPGALQGVTGPSVANVAEALAGKVDEAAKVAPDYSLGNLNERLNAAVERGEDVASLGTPEGVKRLSGLLNNAYGDKRRFAVPALLKRLGARVEPDGRFTRDGADITDKVYAFLEARPGLKPKEADKALAALADEVAKPLVAAAGEAADEGVILYHGSPRIFDPAEIMPGRPGYAGSAIATTIHEPRALGYAKELGTEGRVYKYRANIQNPIEINDLPPQFKGVGGTKFDELFRTLRDPQGNPYDAVVDEAAGNVFVYDRGKLTPIVEAGEALPTSDPRPKEIFLLDASGNKVPLPEGYKAGANNTATRIERGGDLAARRAAVPEGIKFRDFPREGGVGTDNVGWKLHLAVEQDPALANRVADFLDGRGIGYKIGRSGDSEKGMTIYAGSRDDYEALARELHGTFGNRLPALPDGKVPVGDERVIGNIYGRFDTHRTGDFGAYGSEGHPILKSDIMQQLWGQGGNRKLTPEMIARGRAEAARRYGEFYTGTPKGAGDIAAGGGGMGIVSPTGRMLLHNPEVLTTAIGATGGALVGGLTDPDGGADGMLGGALAGGALGYGAGKLPTKAIKQTLGVMHDEGKKAWVEAWKHGGFSVKSLGRDWRDDKAKTVRGLVLDEFSNRVRALVNNIPQRAINGTYRSLLDRRRAAGTLVPYDDELEEMMKLSFGPDFDPAKIDWSARLGQGYMAGAGDEGIKALHPLASAGAGATWSLMGPGAMVPGLAVPVGAARGLARSYTTGGFQAGNDLGHFSVRLTGYKREARALLEEAHTVFAAQLRAVGADPALLSRSDGLYSAEEVAAKYGDEAGKAWRAIQDQIYGVPAADGLDGLAGRFVKDAFGDYTDPSFAHKAFDTIAPFSRYAVGQMKPLAQMAARHPGAALALAHWLQRDRARAKQEGRPGYQVGTVRVDTETPIIGRLVRAQLGGAEGEGRINPTQAALVVSGGQVGATDQFEKLADGTEDATPYKWAEAALEAMGFQFNPAIQAAAYVIGGDFGTDRAPGAQSRTARIEAALPGPQVPGLRGVLDRATEAMGNEADTYDPVELLAKEIIFERTGKPAVDPANAAVAKQLADPNSPLMREARERYQAGGVVANTVSLLSPVTAQASTDEKVAYRQAKVEQAGQEKKTGAAAIYQQPKGLNTYRNGKKIDPRLADWERRNSTLQRVAPKTYARQRAAFIEANKIKP